MLPIFQKELLITSSLEEFAHARTLLQDARIQYTTRIVSSLGGNALWGGGRGRGTLGIKLDSSNQYYIYVHKRDYGEGEALLSGQLRR